MYFPVHIIKIIVVMHSLKFQLFSIHFLTYDNNSFIKLLAI